MPGNYSLTTSTDAVNKARGLTGLPGGDTTFVSDDFTFVSPSIYIAFETVSAIDSCGIVGSPHYYTTLSYAPDAVSTLAHLGDWGGPVGYLPGTYSVFNFADAYCPPFNQNAPYSIMGQTGCVSIA